MKVSEYYQKLFTSYGDPKLIANAFEEYYRRVYERTLEANNEIVNNTSGVDPEVFEVTPLCIDDQVTYYVDRNQLRTIFKIFNEKVANGEIIGSEYYVTITDLDSQTDFQLPIQKVAESLGDAADSCYLTWQGFKAVANDTVESAQEFFNTVSLRVNQASALITNTASNIYSVLSSSESNITAKLSSMISFVGLDKAAEDSMTVTKANIELGNYTGINPVAAWIGGMNWLKLGQGMIAANFKAFIAVNKFVYNCIKTVFVGVYKLASKVFSWIGSWFKKTFVDPVDFSCSDKYMEYWEIPAKGRMAVNLMYHTQYDAYSSLYHTVGDGSTWISDGPVYYHVLPVEDPGEYNSSVSNFRDIFIERYVKPIDPDKLYKVLSKYYTKSGSTTVPVSGNEELTFDELLMLIEDLNAANLSIATKKVGEYEVYYGTYLSMLFSDYMMQARNSYAFDFMTDGSYGHGGSYGDMVFYGDIVTSELDTTQVIETSGIPPIYNNAAAFVCFGLKRMFNLAGYISGQLSKSKVDWPQSSAFGIEINITNLPSSPSDITVTNANFISLLSTWQCFKSEYTTGDNSHLVQSDAFDAAGMGSTDSFLNISNLSEDSHILLKSAIVDLWSVSGYYVHVFPLTALLYIHYATRELQAGTEYDGAYFPYIQGRSPVFKQNISVVTDKQHADAITNFIKGAAILAAAVVAGVVAGTLICNVIRKYKSLSFTRDTIAFNYGDALSKGDVTTANALYKQYAGYNMKCNLLSMCMGKTSSVSGSMIDDLASHIDSAMYSNRDVVEILKPID